MEGLCRGVSVGGWCGAGRKLIGLNVFVLFLYKSLLIFISKTLYFIVIAVSLCCVLRIYEVKGTGDQELNVDFRMCCSESEVQSS